MRILTENSLPRRKENLQTPAREGTALLQGLVLCGRCGNRMTIRYDARADGVCRPVYSCQRTCTKEGRKVCQLVPGASLDAEISKLVVQTMTPQALEIALQVFDELRRRQVEVEALHKCQIERARQEAQLAQRQFLLVNPENRLVADTLERQWNDKLRALAAAEETYAQWKAQDVATLPAESRQQVLKLTQDFPAVWNHPQTSCRERKRLLRLLIKDVTITKGEQIHCQVRWKGGALTELEMPIPLNAWQARCTPAAVLSEIERLAEKHTDLQIAELLNQQGRHTGTGQAFTRRLVGSLRWEKDIPGYFEHLRKAGWWTSQEVCARTALTEPTLKKRREAGMFKAVRCNQHQWLYEPPVEHLRGALAPDSGGAVV